MTSPCSCMPLSRFRSRARSHGESERSRRIREHQELKRKEQERRRKRKKRRRWRHSNNEEAAWESDVAEDEGASAGRTETPMTMLEDEEGCRSCSRMGGGKSASSLGLRRSKADSLHDLRRSAVSSVLRLPPSTPPSSRRGGIRDDRRARCGNPRPASRAKSCCAGTSAAPYPPSSASASSRLDHHASCGRPRHTCASHDGDDDNFAVIFGVGGRRGRRFSRHLAPPPSQTPAPLLDRLLRWPPQLVAVTPNLSDDDDEVERRESYALDEVDSFKVVPKAKNANHHKRVSL